jgi:hypothetical protein
MNLIIKRVVLFSWCDVRTSVYAYYLCAFAGLQKFISLRECTHKEPSAKRTRAHRRHHWCRRAIEEKEHRSRAHPTLHELRAASSAAHWLQMCTSNSEDKSRTLNFIFTPLWPNKGSEWRKCAKHPLAELLMTSFGRQNSAFRLPLYISTQHFASPAYYVHAQMRIKSPSPLAASGVNGFISAAICILKLIIQICARGSLRRRIIFAMKETPVPD